MEAGNGMQSRHSPVYAGGDTDLALSSDSLDDSDTDSLYEERRYQSELQNRIHSNHEVIFHAKVDTEEPKGELKAGDTEGLSHQGKGAKSSIRAQEIHTSYSELRYDPDWRKHQNLFHKYDQDEEEFLDVSSIGSEQCSQEMTLDTSEDRDSVDDHPFWKPLNDVSSKNKKVEATTKPKSKESRQIRKHGAHQNAMDKKTMAQPEASKKDIIEKNKVTLGVRKEKTQSYVHIHKKKIVETKSEQCNEKLDVQPVEDRSHLEKEAKFPEAIEDSRLAGSHIQEKTPKTLKVQGALSNINASQWEDMGVFSGEYEPEYMTIASYPDRYGDSLTTLMGPYSSLKPIQIHNEWAYYQSMRPPEVRDGYHIMETVRGAKDLMETYMYPSQISSQTYTPMAKSTRSNSVPEASTRDKVSNGRTKPCSSEVRRTAEKHQKKLKTFVNQEVKLGGLGPVQTISEEKKKQLHQQKEYAKVIQEQIRNKPVKPREIQVMHNDKNKSMRQKSLEYAKNVPRPQPVPKVSNEKRADISEKRAMSYDSLFPHMKILEDLHARHEKEKMAVAALNALHIL
ncbi:jhy protein homolog [Bufo bufo]|uniref:jhy protein homolog n=1 Tax=Bufo bufo TaxID=8384 RepID=UPI001ABE9C83|nr:jhy protein homolog [Bufo bufo]